MVNVLDYLITDFIVSFHARYFMGRGWVWLSCDKQLDVRSLKKGAKKKLPSDSKLRELILLDEDHMLPQAFLTKVGAWVSLFDIEHGHQKRETRKS